MKCRIPNSGGGNRNDMIRQVQKMQEDMANLQADLEAREYTATAGGGMVSVTVDGKHLVKQISINPDIVDPEEPEMLEDLIISAVNSAVKTATDTSNSEMEKITGGLNIPGLF